MMREIAAVAVRQHFTQASIARALPCSEPAVIKHFGRISPVEETVALYAKALHLETEYIGLVGEPPIALSTARKRVRFKRLVEHLRLAEKRLQVFKPGTTDDVVKHFGALNRVRTGTSARVICVSRISVPQGPVEKHPTRI